jgi:potassium-transporting ATPase KdpC subunit
LAGSAGKNIADDQSQSALETNDPVPADAVTSSGSGLDPHISVANAEIQAKRVAKTRNLQLADVLALVAQHTDHPDLGFLGEPAVNVLELNLALEERK